MKRSMCKTVNFSGASGLDLNYHQPLEFPNSNENSSVSSEYQFNVIFSKMSSFYNKINLIEFRKFPENNCYLLRTLCMQRELGQ